MYCATCGKELAPDGGNCSTCGGSGGLAVRGAASPDFLAILEAVRDISLAVLRRPTEGLPASFARIGKQRALEAGIGITVLGMALVIAGIHMTIPQWARPGDIFIRLFFLAVIMFGSFVGAGFIARKLFHGTGGVEGDVLIAAVSLLPVALHAFVSGLVGITNVTVVGGVAVFAFTWMVLILHSGVVGISAIPQGKSGFAVPLMLIVSLWLTSFVLRGML